MIKTIFILFHSLTLISAATATIFFLFFYLRSKESINLLFFFPALIVTAILILNSYFLFLGRFQTMCFTAVRVITILAGLFSIFAFFVFASAFSSSSGFSWNEFLAELARLPFQMAKDPASAILASFPFFSGITAVLSFFVYKS